MSIETQHLATVLKNHHQDMTGKVVAITGTTSGTGYVCARELARKGAKVLLLNRQSERFASSLKQLQSEVPNGAFEVIDCDLQDFASVRAAAEKIKSNYEVLDILVNNAGVMALKDQATKDGYDVQMQTNMISHFLLTKELFGLIKKSAQGRVVNHTSQARKGAPLEAEYFDKRGGNLGGDGTEEESKNFQGPRWKRYRQTKLANCAFTYGLKEKLEKAGITNVLPLLAHPGLALTNLQKTTSIDGGMEKNSGLMDNAQSAEDGATGIIRAAMDPQAKSGDFFGPTEGWKGYPDKLVPEDYLYSAETIQTNWKGCEEAVGRFEI